MKVGIDFGSTYSAVAAYDPVSDRVEAIAAYEGEPATIPSVVSISKKGLVTCGKAAKDQIGKKSVRIFEAFKMLLTETDEDMLRRRGYDSTYTPKYIARLYLESVLRGVMERRNADRLEEVVICVPEIWCRNFKTLDGRSILRDILVETDIQTDHVRVVTEPEAASAFIAYNYEKETQKTFNGHLLLVDYGGGTLDITLTEVRSDGNGRMEIGYRESGGEGENHPESGKSGTIGCAGIAYMNRVIEMALVDSDLFGDERELDYTKPEFMEAVRDLESQLKSSERMKDIEDVFEEYGSEYEEMADILDDEDREFISVEYDDEEIPVTYQHLYRAYREKIEQVLRAEIEDINARVRKHIGADPCEPAAGSRDDFKIALVGGFGSFYLVKKQIAEIYKLDANNAIDRRVKNIAADKREQAICLGAALLAAGKITQQKTSRYSIGLYTVGSDRVKRLYYGIKCHQVVDPGKPYYICDGANRITYGALAGNITHFAIEFSERTDRGGLMALKEEMLDKLKALPVAGFWNVGFSLDESDIVTFHITPSAIPGFDTGAEEMLIPLDSYQRMFDLTAVKEVTVE